MNMSPFPVEWLYVVLTVDALFLFAALFGIKLLGLTRRAVGMLSLLVGTIILVLGVKNHIDAPPVDFVGNTDMIPVPPFLHYVVYSFVGICLFGGAWLITRHTKKHKVVRG